MIKIALILLHQIIQDNLERSSSSVNYLMETLRILKRIYNLLLSLFVDRSKQLNVHDDVEKRIDHCLEVEEVSVATESIHPSNPHEKSVLH